MNAWIPTIAAFFTMLLVGGAAMLLARVFPASWHNDINVKSLKTSMAMVATMSSLLLGLMVNSARFNYSEAYSDVQKYAASIQITDIELRNFGVPACPLRETLQNYARQLVSETWDVDDSNADNNALKTLLQFDGEVRGLQGVTRDQQQAHSSLLSLSRQLIEYRWKVTGVARTATPALFIAVVICWFALIFAYSGLFVPFTPIAIGGHILAMAAISAAIFMVTELGEPFVGPIQVSSAPVMRLLSRMEAEPCPIAALPASLPLPQ